MKIGIDVDSGERPFYELVEGVLQSSLIYTDSVFFVIGDSSRIRSFFSQISEVDNIVLVDAKDVIGMDESPIIGVKRKKNSTIVTGVNLLKNKTIDILFSPGNTGATVAASVLGLGLYPGLRKPCMGSFFPRMEQGETFILDVGANPEAREDYLYHNSILGTAFYKNIFDVKVPKIGLLSVGTEFGKGSGVIKKAFSYLSGIDGFIGNVEPYNIIDGSVDVVVCDGFTGNTVIKVAESLKKLFSHKFKNYMSGSVDGSFAKKMILNPLKKMIVGSRNISELTESMLPVYYGAAPLLGVMGGVLVGHGMSGKNDVINAIEFALFMYERGTQRSIFSEWKKNK